jgi:multiple sugar transport system substrate-binding protein
MPTNQWEHLAVLSLQTGTSMLRDEGRYGNFESPEFRRAFEFYSTLFAEKLAPPVRDTEISNYWEEFGRGYFAMYITGPWNIGEFRLKLPAELQDDWATTPVPRPDGAPFGISQAGGSGLAISRRSEHKEAAWRFVEFLSRPENQVRLYKLTGNLPPRESSWALGRLADDPPVRAFHEQLKHVAPLPPVPEWEQIASQLMEAGQQVVAGRATIDEAAANLDQAVDDVLDKRRWILAQHAAHSN